MSAELVTPTDIALRWRAGDPAAAAYVVEFATEPGGRYTILEFLPPDRTTFTHPDLIPRTPFYYRVRPVHGPPSSPVEVTMTPVEGAPPGDWTAPRAVPDDRARPERLGAPTNLTAEVVAADGVRFSWTDNATAEAGFLLESRPAGTEEFRVVAVLDPDVNTVGLVTLPEERVAAYRLRAYELGPASNVAHRTTGGP
ncbi:MAG: fibronectin type III domain-containing protein [Actinophytocola sp.]|nr:fibronectin type III domain-containing protein [Actinophytocola sp.]